MATSDSERSSTSGPSNLVVGASVKPLAADGWLTLTIIPADDSWNPQQLAFLPTTTVHEVLRTICTGEWERFIENPEAYGLCFPTNEDMEKQKRKQLKKGRKVGAYRDNTEWLDENHNLSFYKLQDEDELVFKVKLAYLSQMQTVHVVIPSLPDKRERKEVVLYRLFAHGMNYFDLFRPCGCLFQFNYSFAFHTVVQHVVDDILNAKDLRTPSPSAPFSRIDGKLTRLMVNCKIGSYSSRLVASLVRISFWACG